MNKNVAIITGIAFFSVFALASASAADYDYRPRNRCSGYQGYDYYQCQNHPPQPYVIEAPVEAPPVAYAPPPSYGPPTPTVVVKERITTYYGSPYGYAPPPPPPSYGYSPGYDR